MGPLKAAKGFTLVEIMLVLVVLGVILGLATLAIPDTRLNRLQNESGRLGLVLEEIQLEALLQGSAVGLRVDDNSYEVLTQDPFTLLWSPLQRQLFARYQLRSELSLELLVPTPINTGQSLPQIIFDQSGTTAPYLFRLFLADEPDAELRLGSDGFQRVIVQ